MSKYTLVGVNSNAFCILGYTQKAMREQGFSKEEIQQMQTNATSGNYYELIAECQEWLDKCNERVEESEEDSELVERYI